MGSHSKYFKVEEVEESEKGEEIKACIVLKVHGYHGRLYTVRSTTIEPAFHLTRERVDRMTVFSSKSNQLSSVHSPKLDYVELKGTWLMRG